MTPQEARAIIAASRALQKAVDNKSPWAPQASDTLNAIQSSMNVEHPSYLSILAVLWEDCVKANIFGEDPSYVFLRAILQTPALNATRWNESSTPLPRDND
jgi:hypothetical protein